MEINTKNSFIFQGPVLIVLVMFLFTVVLGSCFTLFAGEETLVDRRQDLKACSRDETGCSSCRIHTVEELRQELPFIDILEASVQTVERGNPSLALELEVADSIPMSPGSLTAYSFALDLDGDPDTGFRADQEPIGLFPDLGLDLWVSLSFHRGHEESFLFIGPNNIKRMKSTPGVVKHSVGEDRKSIVFTVPAGRIERKLTFAYLHRKPEFQLELARSNWVAFSSRVTVHYPEENPIFDFLPDRYFRENPDGCPLKPILDY
jgi:hypothetical protein